MKNVLGYLSYRNLCFIFDEVNILLNCVTTWAKHCQSIVQVFLQ